MPLRTYKQTSPGLRQMTRSTFEEITTKEPNKPLLEPQTRGSGRNNQGRLTVRQRGGGEKQHYRRIDFKRDQFHVPARGWETRCRSPTSPSARPSTTSS